MSKYRSLKNSLIAGEISPSALGRSDLPQYPHACKTLKNAIPMLSGGAYRRPGSLYDSRLAEATYSAPVLIPFVVSQAEAYVVALFRTLGTGAGNIAISRATSTALPSSGASSITGTFPAYRTTYNNGTEYDDAHDIQYIQSVDVMWLVHPNQKPQKLRRTEAGKFVIAPFDNGLTGATLRDAYPFLAINSTATTLTPSATTGSITLTASAALFDSGHVGALFKIDHGGTIGCVQITGYTSATVVTATVIVNLGLTTAVSTWWESAWSDSKGWPRSVTLHEGRILYGGNAYSRDSIWCSESNNYQVMSVIGHLDPVEAGNGTTGPLGEQPFTIELRSTKLNLIQWIESGKTLIVGTMGEEWVIGLRDSTSTFSVGQLTGDAKSAYGSSYHSAEKVGSEIYTVSPTDDSVRSLVFNDTDQAYIAEPIQALFDHYPKPEAYSKRKKFRQIAWDESRKTLWCLDTAGNLFGCTRDRKQGVTSWHRHELGGFDSSVAGSGTLSSTTHYYNLCSGSILSMAVIPNSVTGANDLWFTVKRKVNGVWYYTVERIIGRHLSAESAYSPQIWRSGDYFTDCTVYDANFFATGAGISEDYQYGVAHLEGEAVVGTVDSALGIFELSEMTVASGVVNFNEPYPPSFETIVYNIAIGLQFDTVIEPLRPDTGSVIGTSQGAYQRAHTVTVRFLKTLAAKIGRDTDNLDTVYFREADTPMNESPELFTGLKQVSLDSAYDLESVAVIVQDAPLPFAVTSVITEGVVYDG